MAIKESEFVVVDVPLTEIYCDTQFNCRGAIIPVEVDELTRSIEAHGLQQPIVIQPWTNTPGKKWRIISGHRRYTAFTVLKEQNTKFNYIPAKIIEGLDNYQAKLLNLEENIKRKDLNILQEAQAIKLFFEAGWTQKATATALGVDLNWVHTRYALLKLPDLIQAEAAAGILTQEHIKQLAQMKKIEDQYEAVKKIKNAKLLGEKRKIEVRAKKTDPLKKRKRSEAEIFELINIMGSTIGYGLHTRVAAWIAGQISDFEIHQEIKKFAEAQGKIYIIPTDIGHALGVVSK